MSVVCLGFLTIVYKQAMITFRETEADKDNWSILGFNAVLTITQWPANACNCVIVL